MDNQKTDRKEENKSSATCVLWQRWMVQLNMDTVLKKCVSPIALNFVVTRKTN